MESLITTTTTTTTNEDEVTATTSMPSDSMVNRAEFTAYHSVDHPIVYQGIRDFLAKPTLYTTGTWSALDAQNVQLFTGVDIWTLITSHTAWMKKLEGFAFMRFTTCVKVVINASPFQQGKLLLHFLPCVYAQHLQSVSYAAMHNTELTAKTQQPHVELDASESACVLKIPYITPYNWMSIAEQETGPGSFYVSVLSQLLMGTAADTNAGYAVFVWLEDVELSGPQNPQMAGTVKVPKIRKVGNVEKTFTNIETGLSMTARVLDIFEGVPSLSSVCTTAAWVARQAKHVAANYGWSKPVNDMPPTVVTKQPNRYSSTCEGQDVSMQLALKSTNELQVTSEKSLTDADEMAFDYLLRIPALIQSFEIATSRATNSQMAVFTLAPNLFYQGCGVILAGSGGLTQTFKTIGAVTVNYSQGPPIFYFSDMFALWRGTVRFTFKFVKTKFHTGRLMFCWAPYTITAPTTTTSQYLIRSIVDLSTSNELVLDIPFMQTTDYRQTNGGNGYLYVLVLDPIRCPDTCYAGIQVLTYVQAGPGFEFQNPNVGSTAEVFSPQMNSGDDAVFKGVIGDYPRSSQSLEAAAKCVGEKTNSIKELLLRYRQLGWLSTYATFDNSFLINPYINGQRWMTPVTGAVKVTNMNCGIWNHMKSCYCFQRGGIRLGVIGGTSNTAGARYNPTANIYYQVAAATPINAGITNFPYTAITALVSLNNQSGNGLAIGEDNIFVTLPYMSEFRAILTGSVNEITTYPAADHAGNYNYASFYANGSATPGSGYFSTTKTLMAAADDYQLSYFVGCPPKFLSQV